MEIIFFSMSLSMTTTTTTITQLLHCHFQFKFKFKRKEKKIQNFKLPISKYHVESFPELKHQPMF